MNMKFAQALIQLIAKAVDRSKTEHEMFLSEFEALVVSCPPAASRAFGTLRVGVITSEGKSDTFDMALTPADFLWWSEHIANGLRFKNGTSSVRLGILNALAKSAEAHNLTPEERAEFLEHVRAEKLASEKHT